MNDDRTDFEVALDELIQLARTAPKTGDGYQAIQAARARLLALLAPEPEPSDAEIKYVAETLYRDDFGYDASLIAAGDSDQLRYRHMARIALEAAARAARQTGGENAK